MADEIPPSSAISIDPSTFDLVVLGTGLPESLLAAAAAAAGKSVLHLDPHPFYGSHFTSLSPDSLLPFLHPIPPPPPPHDDYLPLETRGLYSDAEVDGQVPDPAGGFLLDVSGPRLLYCADPMVDVMLRSGASRHVDFKSLDGSFVYWEGETWAVPDSREGIFKDKKLGLMEKTRMMAFLKLVKEHIASEGGAGGGGGGIAPDDLELPFVQFLEKQRLPPKIRSIILYAIAMATYDQDSSGDCKTLMKTKEGLASLALYSSSIGRFPNALGAFIYPIYGQGELPQAFCRCAAVKGAIYVLRMPLAGLLINKESRQCKGVRLGSGQDISCQQLVVDPLYTFPSSISLVLQGGSEDKNPEKTGHTSKVNAKVARMICITRRSIQSDLSNILVVFPPKSLHIEQMTTIRALQLSSNVAFCPREVFLLYLSTPCKDAVQGKEYLRAAVNALCSIPDKNGMTNTGGVQEDEPFLLWNAAYVHELTQVSNDMFFSCPMPDGSLDYRNILETTTELFQEMYPGKEFFPKSTEDTEQDEGSLD